MYRTILLVMLIGVTTVSAQVVLCDALTKIRSPVYQGTEGWFFRPVDFETYDLEGLSANLTDLASALREQGVELVVVPLPSRGMVYGDKLDAASSVSFDLAAAQAQYETLIAELAQGGVTAVNVLLAALQARETTDFFLKLDPHWTVEGSRLTAQAVYEVLENTHEVYRQLEKETYTNEPSGQVERKGAIQEQIEKRCGTTLANDVLAQYKTNKATASSELLSETAPPVVLVGTSFSGEHFNFEGFLKETLSTDVLNYFVAGGGVFTSLQDYLLSSSFADAKPKIIIWEFALPMFRPDNADMGNFRQLLPSVYGACDTASVVTQHVPVEGTEVTVFDTLAPEINDKSYYLSLTFSDITIVEFSVNIVYQGGDQETVPIARSTRVANNGKYLLNFASPIESGVRQIAVSVPEGSTGDINGSICHK